MFNQSTKSLILLAALTLTLSPINAGHGSNIAAGFMGAGIGMMAGLALGSRHDHYDSCRHNHHVRQTHHVVHHNHPPCKIVTVYNEYPCQPCYYREPAVRTTYVYDSPAPSYHYYQSRPFMEFDLNQPFYGPHYHNSFSFDFAL